MTLEFATLKKTSSQRLRSWLDSKKNQLDLEDIEAIKSILIYRDATTETMLKAGVRDTARELAVSKGLDWEIVNKPHGVRSEGKFIAHKDSLYWPFHTGLAKPIGKYPCRDNSPKNQNIDLIELGLKLAGGVGAEVTHTSTMRDGGSFLVGIKMPEQVQVGPDIYEQFIYILDNRIGEHSLLIGFGNTCLRCQNQMRMVRNQARYKIKHTISMHEKLSLLVENLDLARMEMKEQLTILEALNNVTVTEAQIEQFISTVTGYDMAEMDITRTNVAGMKEAGLLSEVIEHEMAQVGRTAYGLIQGITNMATHHHQDLYRKEVNFEEAMTYGKSAALIEKGMSAIFGVIGSN